MEEGVARVLDLWNKDAVSSLFFMRNGAWRVPLRSELGEKTLEALVAKLQLRFPVEFASESDQSKDATHPMFMELRKNVLGKNILTLKHRLAHRETCFLEEGIRFLICAKMIETGFPGLMFQGDGTKKRVYGEIAYQIKEPYFPGGDTPFFGRVYPYPVFRITDFIDLIFLHGIIEDFYMQEFLSRLYPHYDLGGELYEFYLLRRLPSGQRSLQDNNDRQIIINGIAIAVAELKLGYGGKWNRLAGAVSDELSQILNTHGPDLFLEVMKHRFDKDFVENAFSILEKLPLEEGRGFGPPLLHDIYGVLNEVCGLYRTQKLMKLEEIERLGIGAKLSGEWGGLRGKIEVERAPPIVFS